MGNPTDSVADIRISGKHPADNPADFCWTFGRHFNRKAGILEWDRNGQGFWNLVGTGRDAGTMGIPACNIISYAIKYFFIMLIFNILNVRFKNIINTFSQL